MLIVLAVAWLLYRLVDIVEYFLLHLTGKTETTLDDQLVPLIRKTIRIFLVIVAALFIAQNIFKCNVGAILAGLGIGGLAFALAAKDMLANFFGSATIFADRPFQMAERIKVKGYDGVVEEVGFRTTRLRLLDGNLVTIPNAIVANEPVENISRRPTIKRILNVTITYDTPPRKVQNAVEILKEMLSARQNNFPADQPPRVYFSDFNAESLNIVVYYWFTPADWWAYLQFNHEFNMELLRRYNEEGVEFAFPTQTLYLKPDSQLQADVHRTSPGESA
jgi:MscS family membrane protein